MPRQNHLLATIASLALLSTAGCQAPLGPGGDSKQLETTHHRPVEDAPQAERMQAATAAADEATIAKVMKEAQAISDKNPAAGKLLLEELSRSEPKLWPLVVQQFRSEQAYHDMLMAKQKATPEKKPSEKKLAVNDPPSAEVGQLADPRGVRSDAAIEQAFAAATPANMPAPIDRESIQVAQTKQPVAPQAFIDNAPAQPLANAQPIVPAASLASHSEESAERVQSALYSIESKSLDPSPPPIDWQSHLELAIDDLSARLPDGPRTTAEVHQVVSLRLMKLLLGDTEAALEPIPHVSTQEQDYWSGQVFALATLLDHHRQPDDKRRAAASVVHLDEAVGHLRELGTLSLRNLAFCKNVYGYGAYEPIADPTFKPGEKVTLYLEIENYHSESTAKGFKTLLGASYEVVDAEGERVASGEFPNVEDVCQSRRRDFHIQYGLVLPQGAKPGNYELKLVMRDRQSDKIGETAITFRVQ